MMMSKCRLVVIATTISKRTPLSKYANRSTDLRFLYANEDLMFIPRFEVYSNFTYHYRYHSFVKKVHIQNPGFRITEFT